MFDFHRVQHLHPAREKLDVNSTFYYHSTDFLLEIIHFKAHSGCRPIHAGRKLNRGRDSAFTLAEAEMW